MLQLFARLTPRRTPIYERAVRFTVQVCGFSAPFERRHRVVGSFFGDHGVAVSLSPVRPARQAAGVGLVMGGDLCAGVAVFGVGRVGVGVDCDVCSGEFFGQNDAA